MDLSLLALWVTIVAAVVIAIRLKLWTPVWRPAHAYQRVFTSGAIGLFFVVTGTIGWRVGRHEVFVAGTHWTDGPIWWQVVVGATLLWLAGFWALRVPPRPTDSRH